MSEVIEQEPSPLHVSGLFLFCFVFVFVFFRSVCWFFCFFFFLRVCVCVCVCVCSLVPFGHVASLSVSLLCRPRTSGSYCRGTWNVVVCWFIRLSGFPQEFAARLESTSGGGTSGMDSSI